MKGVRNRQRLGSNTDGFEMFHDSSDRVALAGNHDVARCVHRGNRKLLGLAFLDDRSDGAFVGENRRHCPPDGERLHEPRAFRDQRKRCFQRVDPCTMRGGELADTVAQDHFGNDPPRAP